jgi:hypothetical protein
MLAPSASQFSNEIPGMHLERTMHACCSHPFFVLTISQLKGTKGGSKPAVCAMAACPARLQTQQQTQGPCSKNAK